MLAFSMELATQLHVVVSLMWPEWSDPARSLAIFGVTLGGGGLPVSCCMAGDKQKTIRIISHWCLTADENNLDSPVRGTSRRSNRFFLITRLTAIYLSSLHLFFISSICTLIYFNSERERERAFVSNPR